MKINESVVDRVIRGAVGLLLLGLGLFVLQGWLAIVIDILGAILLVTGVVGFCPLYSLFGLNTAKKA